MSFLGSPSLRFVALASPSVGPCGEHIAGSAPRDGGRDVIDWVGSVFCAWMLRSSPLGHTRTPEGGTEGMRTEMRERDGLKRWE